MRRTSIVSFFSRLVGCLLLGLLLSARSGQAQTSQGLVADSTELRVLRQFYYATGGDQWTTHTNWPATPAAWANATLAQAAGWYGVQAQQGDITQLVWEGNHLRGPLPACLGLLRGLTTLDCYYNQLSGPIPAELGQLPRLQLLHLGINQLSGPIPAELGQLTQLQVLRLFYNQLSGSIPAALGQLTNVTELSLTDNFLTGSIPAELGQLSQLQTLQLHANRLTGPIPAALGNARALVTLSLRYNQLTGPLPTTLGQLTHLQFVNLSDNQLTGSLPAYLGRFRQLTHFEAGNNQLTGQLPDSLAALVNLSYLDLSVNQLSGPLPARLGDLRQLNSLYLARNQLSGALPASMAQLQNLNQCLLAFNQFSGELTGLFDQWVNLQSLDLGHNQLTGPVPGALGGLPRLNGVGLNDNQLSGHLPAALGTAGSLTILNLTHNQLTGPIPGAWQGLHNLSQLFLSNNRLSGSLSDSLGQLHGLSYLDADHNQLSGTVPASFKELRGLTRLNLSTNQLRGVLPDSLRAVYLNLDNNHFTGSLPGSYVPAAFQITLDNNSLTQLPDFHASPYWPNQQITISGNQLDFTYYETNLVSPGVYQWFYDYGQRARPGDTLQTQPGQAVELNGRIGGAHNQYQWQRQVAGQWVDLPGQTQPSLSWSSVTPAQGGSYRTRVTNEWVVAVLLYSPTRYLDVTPYPALARNLPDDTNPHPQPLQAPPAQTDATAASLAPDMNYVRVWTPRQALTQAAAGPTRPGGVRREQWPNVTGGVADIPVTTPPQAVQQLPSLQATTTSVFQYGARLRAWLTPPQTGAYTFWISATNAGALWLSSDQDPGHAVQLANCTQFTSDAQDYTHYPEQQSAPVTLTAGQHYYLEVRHRHDYGPGYVSVSWQLPDGSQYGAPIAGQYLQPYEDGAPGPDAPTWTVEQASMSTQYLDGLGRPVQTVQWQASPSKHDLVQPQAYDGLGREPRQYLPYAADSTDGGYRPRGLTEQGRYYATLPPTGPPSPQDLTRGVARTGVAFNETLFEASPLNRVVAQAAPGEGWQLTGGHHLERQERPNVFADSVLRFTPSYNPTDLDPHCQGSYAPGELWGVLTRDEHGYWAAEWKDKLGQVVAKQVQTQALGQGTGAARRWLRTCYVYDDLQHLRFVLQPEASRRQLAAVRALAPPPPPTGVRLQRWDNAPGTLLTDIPLTQPPTRTSVLSQLETVTPSSEENFHYGARLQAWLLPPQDGDYTFFLAGNDAAQAWLSLDGDPTHKVALNASSIFTSGPRNYLANAEQQSAVVSLRADRVYYLEVQLKQEWDVAYASLSWQQPDGTPAKLPIAGAYLSPYDETQPPPPAPGSVPLPAAALPAAAQPFVFHYRYDGRGRQIAKQVPGQDAETLVVYDQLDRRVLSQDAQQRTRQEWSWTKYDALGRSVLSGLVTRQDTLGQVSLQNIATADTATAHQYEQRTADAAFAQHLTTTQAFPQLGQNGFGPGLVLTATYYDDYDFDNDGQPDADAHYTTVADAAFASGQAPVADEARVTGLPTRTLTRVLHRPSTDPGAEWLSATSFYDERGRVIQTQSTNARGGQDVVTLQLDFLGKPLRSVARHQGPSLPAPIQVVETMAYDHAERLLSTRQQLPGEATLAPLSRRAYNELGQLLVDSLASGRLAQNVQYAYNIRGWLTSLNDPYSPNPTKHDLFSLSLHYERGFTPGYEQYNGNLTGQTWRGRDGVQRAYGYVYDPLNRLLQGDFVARAGGSAGTLTSATAWNQEQDNYRLAFVSYDDNGNIQTLRRRGLLQNATHTTGKQYGAVDNLSYAYQGNRLQAVDDAVSGNQLPRPANYNGAPTSLAGDFQEQGVKLGQEYLYDANGNLTQDKNKGITGILYNHLNLPRQIHFGQIGDSVVFRYSAAGQKVAKLVYQTGKPLSRTDYLGPYQYEQDSLKFFPHAAGRVLRFVQYNAARMPTVSYQREFIIKDHLGNLRLAYRLGQVRTLLATLEQDSTTKKRERQQFDARSVSSPVADSTAPTHNGRYVAKLNAGGNAPQPLGPLAQLGVQQGDTVTVQAFGYYPRATQHGFFFSLGAFLTSLFHPAQPAPVGADAASRKNLPLLQLGVAAGVPALTQLSGVPRGYLRLLVFDKDSALVAAQTQQVQLSQLANGNYEALRVQLVLPQDGYVTAYVGNESDVDVFFDDVTVEHRPGLQVQETQYDPAGLELAGLAAPSPGIKGLNNYRFNGKEFQADLGLAWNHQDWRFFDPQLLRWHTGDPELENGQESWTPYSFGYDNAVRYSDADGRFPFITIAIGAVVGAGISAGVAIYEGKDTKDVLIAAAGGAVAGAIAGTGVGLIEELGLGAGHAIAVNASAGFVGGAAQETISQGGAKIRDHTASFNTAKIAQNALLGAAGSVAGGLVTDPIKNRVAQAVGTKVAAKLAASTAGQEARQVLRSTLQKVTPALRNNNRAMNAAVGSVVRERNREAATAGVAVGRAAATATERAIQAGTEKGSNQLNKLMDEKNGRQ